MTKAEDVSVVVGTHVPGIGQTLRMALRGVGMRKVGLATNMGQLFEAFTSAEPNVLLIYVDSGAESDPGMQMLTFARRSEACPDRRIPIVIVSQSRDIATIQAVVDAGAHEYTLFPAAGDQLLKKILAAVTSTRNFIDTPEYVGPERRVLPRAPGAPKPT